MDQEPDTTGPPKSSPHFRGERRPRAASPADQSAPNPMPREPHLKPAPSADALPTLFELPNLDPLAPFSSRATGPETQHVVHNRHQGPPAGHFDPPSGDHIPRGQSPVDPNVDESIHTAALMSIAESGNPTEHDFRPTETHSRLTDSRDDESDSNDSWGGRSALVILMLVMVTLAFLAGQKLTRFGDGNTESMMADENGDSLQATELVSESDDLNEKTVVAEDTQADIPSYVISQTTSTIPPAAPASSKAPVLGEPTTALNESVSDAPFPQPIESSPDAVVGFRSDQTAVAQNGVVASPPASTEPLASLPTGMNDRLKLEDGYAESETPFSIKEFLSEEGLRMIDSLNQADVQKDSVSADDLDAAFFESPIEF